MNAILQIFNKTKCENLVSNAADATEQDMATRQNWQQDMAMEAV
jgi:hypothetical protein